LFSDANQIKDWFAKCAKIVAGTGEPVKWKTPLGLPCVQPYKYVSATSIISTILQKLSISENMDDQPVNKSKNTTAFPPNYVHSIDSTHMMLTALRCKEVDITFAAVHDSYWCHAADIPRMNKILRQQFVELHSSPLIDNLNENFVSRYPHEKFPEIPGKGTFPLDEVKNSTYFFS
jgi:DNA-directed RNA polymerase